MSTEMSSHFIHLLRKISLKSDFIQFLYDLTHVYSPGAGADSPPAGDKILISTERPYHFTHLLQVSKKSLWSDFIQFFSLFNTCI